MVTKKAKDLAAGDTIGVSAEALQKPGKGWFKVSVIRVEERLTTCFVHTAGGVICCGGEREFEIVDSDLHTDNLMPAITKKTTYTGRSLD